MSDSTADALLRSVIGIFGHSWWKAQNDLRITRWYEATCDYLDPEPPAIYDECVDSWFDAAVSHRLAEGDIALDRPRGVL